LTVNTR